jgi:hypothetical protein
MTNPTEYSVFYRRHGGRLITFPSQAEANEWAAAHFNRVGVEVRPGR